MNPLYTRAGLDLLKQRLRCIAHLRAPDIERVRRLFWFDSQECVDKHLTHSSDARWGGDTEAALRFESGEVPLCSSKGFARLSGQLGRSGLKGVDVEGPSFAGLSTTPPRKTLLSPWRHRLGDFSHVALICRLTIDNDESEIRTLRVMLNIKAPLVDDQELYQYPLSFGAENKWHRFVIPMRNFILTQDGFVRRSQMQIPRDYIRWFGLSVTSQPMARFALDIADISAVNPPGQSDLEIERALYEAHRKEDKNMIAAIERIRDEWKIQ